MIKIALIGTDLGYCKAFSKSASQLSKEIWITMTQDYSTIETDAPIYEIFILEGLKSAKAFMAKGIVINLMETRNDVNVDHKNSIYSIYKYDNLKSTLNLILQIHAIKTGRSLICLHSQPCELISIISSGGGTGKTFLSVGLAQELARYREKKVLYLNYEEWSSCFQYFKMDPTNRESSLDSYLYFSNVQEKINPRLFLLEDENGIHYFNMFSARNPLKDLTSDEVAHFIKIIMDSNYFDFIVMDCMNLLDAQTFFILKNSSKLLYLLDSPGCIGNYSESKRDMDFLNHMKDFLGHALGDKIIKIFQGELKEDITQDLTDVLILPFSDENYVLQSGYKRINIEKEYGIGLKKVVDVIES